MARVRVDHVGLTSVAQQLQAVPQRFGESRQAVAGIRTAVPRIGDAGASAMSDEMLRQLGWLMEMAAISAAGLTRALYTAAGDYEAAEQSVIRFDGA